MAKERQSFILENLGDKIQQFKDSEKEKLVSSNETLTKDNNTAAKEEERAPKSAKVETPKKPDTSKNKAKKENSPSIKNEVSKETTKEPTISEVTKPATDTPAIKESEEKKEASGTLCIYADLKTRERLKTVANFEHTTVSNYVINLINEDLKKKESQFKPLWDLMEQMNH